MLGVLLAACSASQGTDSTATSGPGVVLRYLALGDSYTIGEGVEPVDRWPVVLAEALETQGFGVVGGEIVARTGWTAAELDQAIGVAALSGTYDLVTVLVGVNDQFRGSSLASFSDTYRTLLDRAIGFAGGAPSRVVAVSIPDWGVTPFAAGTDRNLISAEIDAFNAVVRAIASDAGVVLVDVTGISRTVREMVVADGLHPSAEQYVLWVNAILPAARAALGS